MSRRTPRMAEVPFFDDCQHWYIGNASIFSICINAPIDERKRGSNVLPSKFSPASLSASNKQPQPRTCRQGNREEIIRVAVKEKRACFSFFLFSIHQLQMGHYQNTKSFSFSRKCQGLWPMEGIATETYCI